MMYSQGLVLLLVFMCFGSGQPQRDPLVPFLTANSCGSYKQCIQVPNNCNFDTCDILLTWKTGTVSGQSVVIYEMAGLINPALSSSVGYLSVAMSADQTRGNDYIAACGWDGSNAYMRFGYQYRSVSQNAYGNLVLYSEPMRGYVHSKVESQVYFNPETSRISCTFTILRDRAPENPLVKMSPGVKFTYFFYVGSDASLSDYPNPIDSSITGYGPLYMAPEEEPITSEIWHSRPRGSPSVGVRAHAILMLISWMWLASIGILTARYMKGTFGSIARSETGTNTNRPVYLDGRTWFQIHRSLQIAAVALTVIAFVLIFIVEGKWVLPDFPFLPEYAHPILGCVVMILALINFILGWCAPRGLTRERCVWNWFHWFIGSATHCLSVPTMFIGMSMKRWAWYAPVILFVWVIFHVIVEIILEIHSCCLACCYKDSKKDAKKDAEPLVFQTADGKKVLLHTGAPPRRDGSTFRTILWGIHVGVTSILAITLCFVLAFSG